MKRIIKKISTLLMSAVLFLAVCTGCTNNT